MGYGIPRTHEMHDVKREREYEFKCNLRTKSLSVYNSEYVFNCKSMKNEEQAAKSLQTEYIYYAFRNYNLFINLCNNLWLNIILQSNNLLENFQSSNSKWDAAK